MSEARAMFEDDFDPVVLSDESFKDLGPSSPSSVESGEIPELEPRTAGPEQHSKAEIRPPNDPKQRCEKIVCKFCRKSFLQKKDLGPHLFREHLRRKPFLTGVNGKHFPRRNNRKKGPSKAKKGEYCDVCRKWFSRACYLRNHVFSHSRTHYTCQRCQICFSQKKMLIDHISSYCEGRKTCPCRVSHKCFSQRQPFATSFCGRCRSGLPQEECRVDRTDLRSSSLQDNLHNRWCTRSRMGTSYSHVGLETGQMSFFQEHGLVSERSRNMNEPISCSNILHDRFTRRECCEKTFASTW